MLAMIDKPRMTRAQLRQGSGKGAAIADEHFQELAGSQDFFIYVAPQASSRGYDGLKAFLQAQGCEVRVFDDAPLLPAPGYKAVKITAGGMIISDEALRRAHRWAHQRNLLHSFFKPLQAR